MRTLTVFAFFIFLSSFVLVNCAQSSKRIRKPVTSIKIIPKNKNYTVGDKLTVNFQTKIKDGTLTKTEFFIDGKSVFTSDKIEGSFEIESKNYRVGTRYLKSLSTLSDGTTGENYTDFLLLSDIIPQRFSYKIIKTLPHNIEHFTEGFEIRNGFLYESTGQEGTSSIYKIDLSSWKVVKEIKLDDKYFGEGITILNGKIYQLTYKTQIGFVRDLNTFELIKTFTYKNAQGWGFTNDGKYLIMSDGTEYLTFLDSETLSEVKKIQVCNQKGIVANLNELEYINGEIWANVWTTDTLVRIDPKTGKIVAEIDLKGLLGSNISNQNNQVDVLNGIAYDQDKGKIYVTGKFWPKIFEIELVKNTK
ncbi:MAG TPA: glutaminyl-peptide cyclotransferase [Prolixibacteraceae bacterium]|nr:glutaminyl-peptide cyclotransferase [Prolixibacteraceae bacterium]